MGSPHGPHPHWISRNPLINPTTHLFSKLLLPVGILLLPRFLHGLITALNLNFFSLWFSYRPHSGGWKEKQIFFSFYIYTKSWLSLLVTSTDALDNSLIIHTFLWCQGSMSQHQDWDQWDSTYPLGTFLTISYITTGNFSKEIQSVSLPDSLSEEFSWAHCMFLYQNTTLRACLVGNLSP